MLMFPPLKGRSFLTHIFETLVLWGLAVKALTVIWEYWGIASPALTWAYTVATGFAAMYIAMFVCFTRQSIYQARIEEKAKYCSELEQKLLKKRLSSKKRN